MRFEQLECLLAIAETGSFTEAAKRLFLTQQAVSMSIKQLEQEIGQTLFRRENNGVVFTKYGEEMTAFAQKFLTEKEALLAKMQNDTAETPTLLVKIGSTSSVVNITLPNIIAKLQAQKKKTSVRMARLESLDKVLEEVKNHEKDIGLVSINKQELNRKFVGYADVLQMEILAMDELVAVANRKYYQGQEWAFDESHVPFFTQYNIDLVDEYKFVAQQEALTFSDDADFHRIMLEKVKGMVVLMSGLSYQYFFDSKKYISLPLNELDVQIAHAIIYHRHASEQILAFIPLIRQEMYLK